MAGKLHDEAPLSSSLGRFVNDFLAARERNPALTPEAMFPIAYEAYSRTQYFSPSIKKQATAAGMAGIKSKCAFWFRLVEVALGLVPDHLEQLARSGNPNDEGRTQRVNGDKSDPPGPSAPVLGSMR